MGGGLKYKTKLPLTQPRYQYNPLSYDFLTLNSKSLSILLHYIEYMYKFQLRLVE